MTSQEKTFTDFTPAQAAAYASGRGSSYAPELYRTILAYHQGQTNLLLDAGCGPGKVVFDLMPPFAFGIGTDSSAGMIEQAAKDAAKHGLADKTAFSVFIGEECYKALADAPQKQADVLTVAMAAHWMDMPAFYRAAERALAPGGTLAIWTCSSLYIHPSTRNAMEMQAALSDLEDNILGPYHHPNVKLTRTGYDTLPLPWTIDGFESCFKEADFVRKDWDRYGVPSAPDNPDGTPGPFLMDRKENLTEFEMGCGSASSVVRWRDANPHKAHTDEDPVNLTMRRLRAAAEGAETFWISPSLSLLLMRKT